MMALFSCGASRGSSKGRSKGASRIKSFLGRVGRAFRRR